MTQFIQSGLAYELIMSLILLEFFGLLCARRFLGAVFSMPQLSATLLAGGLLVVSFVLANSGADPLWVLGCLFGCGAAHLTDVLMRVRLR